MFRATTGIAHYFPRPMKIPVCLSALPCIAVCIFVTAGGLPAESVGRKAAIPVLTETTHAPTDLAALRKRLGRRVVIEGKIVAAGSSRTGSVNYLNFTNNHHDSVSLVFLGGSGKKGIAKEQLAAFVGKKIHVGGLLEDWNGALQMRVFELEQIKVLP